jgi:hypothetical protein
MGNGAFSLLEKNIEVLLMFQANGRYPFLSEYLFRGSANLVTG